MWCNHVEGYWNPRSEDMDPEDPIQVDILCLVCKTHHRTWCYTGHVDRRISVFALLHRECWFRTVTG